MLNISENDLTENLTLAGCDSTTINTCLNLIFNNNKTEMKKLIAKQRKSLLDDVHKKEKQIFYLDYFSDKLHID